MLNNIDDVINEIDQFPNQFKELNFNITQSREGSLKGKDWLEIASRTLQQTQETGQNSNTLANFLQAFSNQDALKKQRFAEEVSALKQNIILSANQIAREITNRHSEIDKSEIDAINTKIANIKGYQSEQAEVTVVVKEIATILDEAVGQLNALKNTQVLTNRM